MGGEGNGIGSAEAASALRWWLESGVDIAVQDEPRNWLAAEVAEQAQPTAAESHAPAAQAPAAAPAPPAVEEMPDSLPLFRDWLGETRTMPHAGGGERRVLPRGVEDAPIMILADAPASEEAASGVPIAGDAWALTERMLAAIGIPVDQAYVANISCVHRPGKRLTSAELQACAAVARRHVALARPKRLLLFGDGPSLALFGKPVAAARNHAHVIEGVRTVVTFHPRFLINRPSDKSLAWKDLLLLMEDKA